MKLLFELSKEFGELPRDEVKSCLKSEKISFKIIDENDDVLIIDTKISNNKIKKISNRLALSFNINDLLFYCDNSIEQLKQHSKNNIIKKQGSIAVTYKKRSNEVNTQRIIKLIAENYAKDRRVDLENPDIEIRTIITDQKIYVGTKIMEIDRSQYEKRKVQNRPFFLPISLHPKIARAFVNISEINEDKLLLDPFCGTGGMLLEAGILGAKIIGSDIEEKMIEGCKKTLDFFNINNYKLFCCDINDINKQIDRVDAVVTDFPYGKSTTTKGEDILLLQNRAFDSISKILKKDKIAIFGMSNKDNLSKIKEYFTIKKIYGMKVHRSLTRYFIVVKK